MIQAQTYLNVADNSGAQELMCIRIVGAKGLEVIRAIIIRTCEELKHDTNIIIRYDDNAAIVINDQEREIQKEPSCV
ncbi:hypothetical protein AMTRI_Chr01g131500 [Amborella trichopoda]